MNWYKMITSQHNDWYRIWTILKRELESQGETRDPTPLEVQRRLLERFQDPILDLPEKPKETLFG